MSDQQYSAPCPDYYGAVIDSARETHPLSVISIVAWGLVCVIGRRLGSVDGILIRELYGGHITDNEYRLLFFDHYYLPRLPKWLDRWGCGLPLRLPRRKQR